MKHTRPSPIASLDLFADCTRTEHDLIERLATIVDVDAGVVLCGEGDLGQTFYAIAQGEVLVTVDGNEIACLGAGCGFGEIALLRPDGRRVATATTTIPSRLILFSRPEFATLMVEVPLLAHRLIAEARRRLNADDGGAGPFATS
jgi:CRP-like cAMP-binding protein